MPPPETSPRATRRGHHAWPLLLFAALTVLWTWPLVAHLGSAVPGEPGDNYSFLWNLWWMRHVGASHLGAFFHTDYLLYPMGTSLVDHPHTALPAWVAATVLGALSVVAAQNVLLLVFVFTNMVAMYALAWDLTRHRRASVLAAVLFGTCPYFSAHLRGHFDLMAAWVLPAFALSLRRALDGRSTWPAVAAGGILVATAYTVYYYVVYLGLLTLAYLAGSIDGVSVRPVRRPRTGARTAAERAVAALLVTAASAAAWIAVSGGGRWAVGPIALSARTPQNALTLTWLLALAWMLVRWRLNLGWGRRPDRRTLRQLGIVALTFVAGAAPLLVMAAGLIARGEYTSQTYYWRSGPQGLDLLAPLLGPPFHPLTGTWTTRAFAALGADPVEGVAWLGLVPLAILILRRVGAADRAEARRWWFVLGVFAVWMLGPILTIWGFDTGVRLPQILARFVPVVSNARMPGRGMVVVYLAMGVLVALRLAQTSRAGGPWSRPAWQWLLVGLLAFEYADAPIALTPLDPPPVYTVLAGAPPGAVCEVPFGIGDGLGGVGSQERRTLWYATLHGHPMVGGYIGRLPPGTLDAYLHTPVVGELLALSPGPEDVPPGDPGQPIASGPTPCRYVVVDRGRTPAPLMAFVRSLPLERLASDDAHDLYQFAGFPAGNDAPAR
jgi:hypothetical protein